MQPEPIKPMTAPHGIADLRDHVKRADRGRITIGIEETAVSPGRARITGPLSVHQIADLLGLSPQRVFQLENTAMEKLRRRLGSDLLALRLWLESGDRERCPRDGRGMDEGDFRVAA